MLRELPVAHYGPPRLGNSLGILVRRHVHLAELRRRYGDRFAFHALGQRMVLLFGSDGLDFFFTRPEDELSFYEGYRAVTGHLFPRRALDDHHYVNEFARWLNRESLDQFLEVFAQETHACCDALGEAGRVDVFPFLFRVVLRSMLRTFFGDAFSPIEYERCERLWRELDPDAPVLTVLRSLVRLPAQRSPRRRRFDELMEYYGHVLRRAGVQGGPNGFLDHLLALARREGQPLDVELGAYRLNTAILFPHGNVVGVAAWMLLFLLADRPAWVRASEELDRHPLETYADGKQLRFVHDAIFETGRLTLPPAFRMAMRDLEYEGYRIRKGDLLPDTAYFMHRDPAVYRNPERFDPLRFSDERREGQGVPFSLNVFGAGPHSCLGKHYAIIQIKSIVKVLNERFELDLAPELAEGVRTGKVRIGGSMWRPNVTCAIQYRSRARRVARAGAAGAPQAIAKGTGDLVQ